MSLSSCNCSFPDTPFLTNVCGGGLFMVMTEMLLLRQCDMADACRRPQDEATTKRNEYDFIVVGAGVAGPVMASRLSENPDWNVLLVEAGPQEPTITEIPAYCMSAVGTVLDWKYTTESSSIACLGSGGRCRWPRGKMVSGSSGMQGMMYTRPHPSILDEWNKTNPGWSFQDCLPYYKKSETNLNPDMVEPEYHGTDGPMTVQQFPTIPPLCDVVLQAGEQMGYERGDLCGSNQTRVGIAQMMVFEGLRMSTSRAYIRPYLNVRDNLEVLINSQVTKILIDQETKTATGVEYVDKLGNTHTVYANKEVILSAGAVNSPQLLLLSGIGSREHLEEVGIDVIVELPGVGYNAQNHLSAFIDYLMDAEEDINTFTFDAIEEFINNRTGNLTNTGLSSATMFVTSKYATNGVPDLQFFFGGYQGKCTRTGSINECSDTIRIGNCGKRRLTAVPTNVMTLSRGYLKLRSSNPLDYPLIYSGDLENRRDIDVLIDGLRFSIELAKTPALQKYNLSIDDTKMSGCENYDFGSDEYFECTIRLRTGVQNHQAGTCKMGPADDTMAVVDNNLKVYGVNNIRVVDASFFPFNPNSNPTSVIIMAAEKIADVIKETWS